MKDIIKTWNPINSLTPGFDVLLYSPESGFSIGRKIRSRTDNKWLIDVKGESSIYEENDFTSWFELPDLPKE
ncbi:MAG: hypothetical protein Q4F84_09500 [Fibrobacter sp.]|nr:hypothetical protein [Fibrobacter sp.]